MSERGYVLLIVCAVVAFIVLVVILIEAKRASRRRVADKKAPQPSLNPPRPASTSRRTRPLLVVCLVVALVIVGVGVGWFVMTQSRAVSANRAQRLDKLRVPYEAVVAIQAATGVGVSYTNYGPLLGRAATALAVYEPEDDEARRVASQLAAALGDYRDAGVAWSIKLLSYPESHDRWEDFVSNHSWVRSELRITTVSPSDSELDRVIQHLWRTAGVYMEAARDDLAAYRRHSD